MHAAWYLSTTPNGPEVRYRNLHDGRSLFCGTAGYLTFAALLDYMVREGCGDSESVFSDGQLVAFLMRPARGTQ